MKHSFEHEPALGRLLREARPKAEAPPGFQQAVWRRIEREEAAGHESSLWLSVPSWIERFLRLRWALATMALLLAIGMTSGAVGAVGKVKSEARERYMVAVSPFTP